MNTSSAGSNGRQTLGAAAETGHRIDETDQRLIVALRRRPRASVSELSRLLSLARGTVHTRLDRLEHRGVITGYGPDLDLAAAGYPVRAFTTLSIAQGHHDQVVGQLRSIPQILEIHTITGPGDLLVKIAARSNDHLHDLLQIVSAIPEVSHSTTQLALASPVLKSGADLLADVD